MRIIRVWVTATAMIFMVSIGWWTTQPVILSVGYAIANMITSASGLNVKTAVEYACYAWGPLLIIFILLWAVYSSQQRDIESELYG